MNQEGWLKLPPTIRCFSCGVEELILLWNYSRWSMRGAQLDSQNRDLYKYSILSEYNNGNTTASVVPVLYVSGAAHSLKPPIGYRATCSDIYQAIGYRSK